MIDATNLNKELTESLTKAVQEHVEKLFLYDKDLLNLLKKRTIEALVRKVTLELDVTALIADKIAEQFAEQFNNTGIYNESPNRELSVTENVVVIENNLVTKTANILDQTYAKNVLITGALKVDGEIDLDTNAWDGLADKIKTQTATDIMAGLTDEVVSIIASKSDSINRTQYLLNNKLVLSENTLGTQITDSTLQKVGRLRDLTVIGETSLANNTIYAGNARVGINTDSPSAALDVWDAEIEIVIGKFESQTAFVGTARDQDLVLGVNRKENLRIDKTGVVTVQKFKIGNQSIRFGSSIPGTNGSPGDIVFNNAMSEDNLVFAWYCLHDFSWLPLKAA